MSPLATWPSPLMSQIKMPSSPRQRQGCCPDRHARCSPSRSRITGGAVVGHDQVVRVNRVNADAANGSTTGRGAVRASHVDVESENVRIPGQTAAAFDAHIARKRQINVESPLAPWVLSGWTRLDRAPVSITIYDSLDSSTYRCRDCRQNLEPLPPEPYATSPTRASL